MHARQDDTSKVFLCEIKSLRKIERVERAGGRVGESEEERCLLGHVTEPIRMPLTTVTGCSQETHPPVRPRPTRRSAGAVHL